MPGTSTEQVVDKGIRQKSIHSFHSIHSFTDGSAFCPGAPKRVPSDSEKHRRVYTSSNVCHSHEWRVDTASGKTLKKRNACIYGLRSEGVKQLFHIGVWKFAWFVWPPLATILCVWEMWSGSNNRIYTYHVLHSLAIKKDYQKKKKRVTAPILKLTYNQKPETFLGGLNIT